MNGKTKQDMIMNRTIRKRVEISPIIEKMVKNRLTRFGHAVRRPIDVVVRKVD